jgi:hypothetical protein
VSEQEQDPVREGLIKTHLQFAADYNRSPKSRDAARNRLITTAKNQKDENLWIRIGAILVDAFQRKDLTSEMCENFTHNCPDEIFALYANGVRGTNAKGENYIAWEMRAKRLASQPPAIPKQQPEPPGSLI